MCSASLNKTFPSCLPLHHHHHLHFLWIWKKYYKLLLYVLIAGYVFVDGLEMKMRLPPLTKGSALTFQTEPLPNGKVRILVQIKDKEMAFDWKIEQPVDLLNFAGLPQMGFPLQRQASANQMLFALKFSHEYWKVSVEWSLVHEWEMIGGV